MPVTSRRSILHTAFTVNAVLSGACGAAFLVAGAALGPLFGLAPAVMWVLGAGLLAFAAHLASVARRPLIGRGPALYFLVCDVAWVAASAAILLGWPQLMTGTGRLVFAVIADAVALLAVAEFVGYRRLAQTAATQAA
jgi:hypothetical protein